MTLQIQALGPAIGALVSGIRLCEPLSNFHHDALLQALLQHHVLFFENQPITPVQQRDLAARFGPLHIHPIYQADAEVPEIILLDTSTGNPPDNDNWHTDVTFIETPPMAALLSAKVLPPGGGDTLWSSGIAALDALSPSFQKLLTGLTAEHDMLKSFHAARFARTAQEQTRYAAAKRASSSTKASPPASWSSARPRVMPCWPCCSSTLPNPNSPCAGAGRPTTLPSGTTA